MRTRSIGCGCYANFYALTPNNARDPAAARASGCDGGLQGQVESRLLQKPYYCTHCVQLVHMIAEGPLGPTLLVEEKCSGDKCVIKKV